MSENASPVQQSAKKCSRWRRLFRFPLWFLLLLVVPFAFIARDYVESPEIVYSETRSGIVKDADTYLDFKDDLNGARIKIRTPVDEMFSSLGVSFRSGIPAWLPEVKNDSPLYQVRILGEKEVSANAAGRNLATPALSRNSLPSTSEGSYIGKRSVLIHESIEPEHTKSIGTIKYLDSHKRRTTNFRGLITIIFHQPSKPGNVRGVSRFGFVAGSTIPCNALEVRCYSPQGHFLCRQKNISEGTVFMGFKSNRKIGWVELELVKGASNGGIAVGALSFGD